MLKLRMISQKLKIHNELEVKSTLRKIITPVSNPEKKMKPRKIFPSYHGFIAPFQDLSVLYDPDNPDKYA
jgi:hypothetical protein